MSIAPLVVEIGFVCMLVAYFLHRYGNWRKQHMLVTLATFVSWYFAFMIVFILPLDVSTTFYRQCLSEQRPAATTKVLSTTTTSPNASLTTASANITTTSIHVTTPTGTSSVHRRLIRNVLNNGTGRTSSRDKVNKFPTSGIAPCEVPWSHVPDNVLSTFWKVIYWSSQILTWLILPMMQSYSNAGNFTVLGKIKTALIENAIFYGSYLLIFGVCLVYVASTMDIDAAKLKVIGVTASNTWGLFLLVLLLGYGLVEIPRSKWNDSKRGHMLAETQFKIAKLSTEKSEAEESLEDVLEDIKKSAEVIKYNSPLRKHLDTVLDKCPEGFRKQIRTNDDYEDYNGPTDVPTENSLVRLHKRVITAIQNHHRTQCQWNTLVENAFEYEDIAYNEISSDQRFRTTFRADRGVCQVCYSPAIEWYWKCLLKPWSLRILVILLAIFSIMVVWSEVTFFVKSPVLSLFAIFINLAKENYDYLYIEITSFLIITYLCVCAYYTVFKIRVFNYYYIAPHHQTDENSLLFSGMLLCRLTPPLCLNFLGLIHLDSHVTNDKGLPETAYTAIMGHMDVIPFIAKGFNIYFPIAIILLCIATYFHLGSRCLHCLGFQQFIGDDDMTADFINEGKELIRREKRKRERKEDGESRRRRWNERFGEGIPGSVDSDSEPVTRQQRSTRNGKYEQPVSPSHHSDRTELLRDTDPLDYSDSMSRDSVLDRPQSYQSERPTRIQKQPNKLPPRGIFDDL